MSDSIRGEMRFSLCCQKCGGNELTIPDEPTDDSPVTCATCGDIARWGDVKTAMLEASQKEATKAFQDGIADAVKGLDNIEFKF